ncbi:MAG: RAMP superfamily CRISPR-associated protein [Gloeomargarita sp. SKYG98]|nr:RAMP superfamily CRISPR-associated protein [Gloeomargarita sp. SKYG98]
MPTRPLLPTHRPRWYGLKVDLNHPDRERGYTPQTADITDNQANRDITQAWNGRFLTTPSPINPTHTVSIGNLKLISPLQIGGGSFPEGGILPAQVAGIPWIPGSSIRGSLLHYLRKHWHHLPPDEQAFWQTLTNAHQTAWLPRKIRFECIYLDKSQLKAFPLNLDKSQLKAFPLNPQQPWQIFNERDSRLGIQWQLPADVGINAATYTFNITLRAKLEPQHKSWISQRIQEMLRYQGLGRGTHAGFGRMAERIPQGQWQIHLQGMKPCVQPHIVQQGKVLQQGRYRWSPQVLRANLRGWFMRLALPLLGRDGADRLTNKIFGGLGCPAALILCSYKTPALLPKLSIPDGRKDGYANIPSSEAHETWEIQVECNEPFRELIGDLLNLAQQLGGLGPGWRRPPHRLARFNGFRGSQFTLLANSQPVPAVALPELISRLQQQIRHLAETYKVRILAQPYQGVGQIYSIWESDEPTAWEAIVHDVCSTGANPRPSWCGNSQDRPSGYAVRQLADRCRITVFDPDVEPTLQEEGFRRVWPV